MMQILLCPLVGYCRVPPIGVNRIVTFTAEGRIRPTMFQKQGVLQFV